YDKEGKLTDANQSALEIFGIPSLNDCLGLKEYPIFTTLEEAKHMALIASCKGETITEKQGEPVKLVNKRWKH
ncbi:MAG: hypothetical protein ACXVHR_03635, partial [Methanobacterium sp.]